MTARVSAANTFRIAPIGLLYGVSDICVYFGVAHLSAAAYTVLRQVKLPLTAALPRVA